jgi:hypothetical protein
MIEQNTSVDGGGSRVRRRIPVPALRHAGDGEAVERALAAVDGVLRVSADTGKRAVTLDYLLTETDYQSLEGVLDDTGFPAATARWARIRSGWYQNLDLTGRANAAASPGACCNKPPAGPKR